jgi:NAD(P)-dependent dehydrogenase (short-subunit alcohol dehydrogenase family)
MDRLRGKVALISGVARGQGAAESGLVANEGAKVVIADVLVLKPAQWRKRSTARPVHASR